MNKFHSRSYRGRVEVHPTKKTSLSRPKVVHGGARWVEREGGEKHGSVSYFARLLLTCRAYNTRKSTSGDISREYILRVSIIYALSRRGRVKRGQLASRDPRERRRVLYARSLGLPADLIGSRPVKAYRVPKPSFLLASARARNR